MTENYQAFKKMSSEPKKRDNFSIQDVELGSQSYQMQLRVHYSTTSFLINEITHHYQFVR